MKKFEYKKYTKLDIIHFGNIYFYKNEQIKSQKSAILINEDVFFEMGLNALGESGWELIQIHMFNPSKAPTPIQDKDNRDYEIFYFKREIK